MTSVSDYLRRAKELFEAKPPEERATAKLAQAAWREAQEQAHTEYLATLPPCGYCGEPHPSFDCPGLDEMVPLPTPLQTENP